MVSKIMNALKAEITLSALDNPEPSSTRSRNDSGDSAPTMSSMSGPITQPRASSYPSRKSSLKRVLMANVTASPLGSPQRSDIATASAYTTSNLDDISSRIYGAYGAVDRPAVSSASLSNDELSPVGGSSPNVVVADSAESLRLSLNTGSSIGTTEKPFTGIKTNNQGNNSQASSEVLASTLQPGRDISRTGRTGDVQDNSGVYADSAELEMSEQNSIPEHRSSESYAVESAQNVGRFSVRYGNLQSEGMPSGDVVEDKHHVQPIVHENIHLVEVEEVTREKHIDRHVHHIQHHVQPIIQREECVEQQHYQTHPISRSVEHHSVNPEDLEMLRSLLQKTQQSITHSEPQRRVVDKGTVIYENVHHHHHHIIQPVIQNTDLLSSKSSEVTSSSDGALIGGQNNACLDTSTPEAVSQTHTSDAHVCRECSSDEPAESVVSMPGNWQHSVCPHKTPDPFI